VITNKNNWLKHINREMTLQAKGLDLCPYLIALEGWRRGLKLTWLVGDTNKSDIRIFGQKHIPMRLFSLSSDEKKHYFFRSRGDLVSNKAINVCMNKEETKKYLLKNNVPTPLGKRFTGLKDPENRLKAVDYSQTIDFPVVIKPTKGSLGKGVIANIKTIEELEESLNHVIDDLNYSDIIIEQYFSGREYRVYVVGDKIAGAVEKIPPNIIGDGINTIQKLINI